MADLGITIDDKEYARKLRAFFVQYAEQVPFANALALTWTARDARQQLAKDLPQDFTVRSPWTARQMRFEPATKTSQVAEVGSLAPYMRDQALGGVKLPRPGKSSVPVPVGARPTAQSKTPPRIWPRRLLTRRGKTRGFVQEAGSGSGVYVPGTGAANKLMWLLPKRVKIPARWPLRSKVNAVMAAVLQANLDKAMRRAVATARRKAGGVR